ncbi:hypothetical protein PCANC_24381 [Puccinia coronata f. sp. avenae]|uniref:Uncharacterized protein n=1 Tax=Puccinia coronata f. sp. avenae TaxID=200324 RepID=A0A2N5SFI2_9BASI|nr:hypothetical protein PCANC_24381 [Puccinia coronata f. sp. avenae]
MAYWIKRLQREREEYLRTYKLSPYDLLSYNKKLQRALDRIKACKEAKLDYQIAFNALLNNHRKTHQLRQTEKMAANNNNTNTTGNTTIVQNYLNRPVALITTPFLTGKTTTTTTNKESNETIEDLKDLIDYKDTHLPGYSPHQQELRNATARSQTLTKRVKALKVLRIQPIDKTTSASMEIDDPILQGATPLPQKSVEDDLEIITKKKDNSSIKPLSKKETISTLVKAHVALRDRFNHAQMMKNKQAMKILLF